MSLIKSVKHDALPNYFVCPLFVTETAFVSGCKGTANIPFLQTADSKEMLYFVD